jgi:hypothetical protein
MFPDAPHTRIELDRRIYLDDYANYHKYEWDHHNRLVRAEIYGPALSASNPAAPTPADTPSITWPKAAKRYCSSTKQAAWSSRTCMREAWIRSWRSRTSTTTLLARWLITI